jgi:hypothetical protein
VCFAKYGSMSLKVKCHSEMSLRILLNALETAANRYKRYIVPWVSLSIDFYVRVFVRVYESPAEVKNSMFKRSMLYHSTQCPAFYLQPLGRPSSLKKDKPSKKQAQKVDSARQQKLKAEAAERAEAKAAANAEPTPAAMDTAPAAIDIAPSLAVVAPPPSAAAAVTISAVAETSSSSSSNNNTKNNSKIAESKPSAINDAPSSSSPLLSIDKTTAIRKTYPEITSVSSEAMLRDHSVDNGKTNFSYGADVFRVPDRCLETGGQLKIGGPFWTDPLHRQDIVDEVGHVGMWVCGYVGMWVCEYVGMWVCGYVGM